MFHFLSLVLAEVVKKSVRHSVHLSQVAQPVDVLAVRVVGDAIHFRQVGTVARGNRKHPDALIAHAVGFWNGIAFVDVGIAVRNNDGDIRDSWTVTVVGTEDFISGVTQRRLDDKKIIPNVLCDPTNIIVGSELFLITHVYVGIGSGNGSSTVRCLAITWTNFDVLSIGPLGTKFSKIWIEMKHFSLMKRHLKMWSVKWRPFCELCYILKQILCKRLYEHTWIETIPTINTFINVTPDDNGIDVWDYNYRKMKQQYSKC